MQRPLLERKLQVTSGFTPMATRMFRSSIVGNELDSG